ncbi:MAG: ABC transporter permease subunit, partial [Candidatus Promineifilaceae bacterium]|nr:ABC transporter permease subunit [Candidatus Promineifilaceae bacterium]
GASILLSDFVREGVQAYPPVWTSRLLDVWALFNRFPQNIFIRMPFLAFTAVLFAGEYQWGTWKNVIPRRRRLALILTKFLALGLLIIVALTLTSLVWWAGGWLNAALVGVPYGPELTADVLADFSRTYLSEAAVTFASTLIIAAYAALFAMASRSILASLLLSVGVAIVEFASALILIIVGQAFNRPHLVNVYATTPTYNLTNISSWIGEGIGSSASNLPGFTAVLSLPQSILIVALWVVGLVTLTAVLFRRQDITS